MKENYFNSLERLINAVALLRGTRRTERQRFIQGALSKVDGRAPYKRLKVLVWEPGGMPAILTRDAIIATSLKVRGASLQFVICDGTPSACILREVDNLEPVKEWSKRCSGCLEACSTELKSFGLNYKVIGDFINKRTCQKLRGMAYSMPFHEITSFQLGGVQVGQFALSSTIRYLKGQAFDRQEEILREYHYAALVHVKAAGQAFEQLRPDRILMSHGIYVDYGVALSVALNVDIPTTVWYSAYFENHFYMGTLRKGMNGNIQALSNESWEIRQKDPLVGTQELRLDNYLKKRYSTGIASDLRLAGPPKMKGQLRDKLKVENGKPIWCLFSHLAWDAVFNFAPMTFPTIGEWLFTSIKKMIETRDVTWLLKIHPAETFTGTTTSLRDLISKDFPSLPSHIQIIPNDTDINPLDLYSVLDGGITIFGTAGLELAMMGKQVILAGEAHYSGKGFTHHGRTISEYQELLGSASSLPPLTSEQVRAARQYSYCYFLERQIPFTMVKKGCGGWGSLDDEKIDLLLPGRDRALDLICKKIAEGGDFVLDEDALDLYSSLIE